MFLVREVAAFYRILFGHQDVLRVGVRQLRGGIRVVVRKRMGDEIDAEPDEMQKKTLGMSDPGNRVHAPIAKVLRPGTVLFEIGGTSEQAARMCFSRLAHKMPVRVRMIRRQAGA